MKTNLLGALPLLLAIGMPRLATLAEGAASEQPGAGKAYCPVVKPQVVIQTLAKTLSSSTDVTTEERKEEIKKLFDVEPDEDVAMGLRWLVHQTDQRDDLKELGCAVLMHWRRKWLGEDIKDMVEDKLQPLAWRAKCVKGLAILHDTTLDQAPWDALENATRAPEQALRDVAIEEVGNLCGRWKWSRTNPAKYKFAQTLMSAALANQADSTRAAALRGIMWARLEDQAPAVETLASDPKQPSAIRVAAMEALGAIPRWQTLPVLKANLKATDPALVAAATKAQPFILTAQLDHKDPTIAAACFDELVAMGKAAYPALNLAMDEDNAARKEMAKGVIAKDLVKNMEMPPFDRKGLTVFGADPEKGKEGVKTILMDKATRRIVIEGKICLDAGPLEYAVVCDREGAKMHESVIGLDCSPMDICYALLACNYTYASELRDEKGKVNLPKGAGVMFSVEYERTVITPQGKEKKLTRLPLQALIWNEKTGRPMHLAPWAFTGSRMERLPNGKNVLLVLIEKSIVAIKTDPNALLNNPLDTADLSDVNPNKEGAYYMINRALAPNPGTKCSLIFEPWTGEDASFSDQPEAPKEKNG